MEEKIVTLRVENIYYLHRIVYGKEHRLPVVADKRKPGLSFQIVFAYDYERLPDNTSLIHCDISFDMVAKCKMMVRITISCTAELDELFSMAVMQPIVKLALDRVTTGAWKDFCAENNLKLKTKVRITAAMIKRVAQSIIDEYVNKQAIVDAKPENQLLSNNQGLDMHPGQNSLIPLMGTFVILDHVLYENPVFDCEHNREFFKTKIPLPVYETLKWKCIQIEKNEVQLNWKDTVVFFVCMDCALQMLLGHNADKLIPGIEKSGMNEAKRNLYITYCTDMIRNMKNILIKSGVRIKNLETQYNWTDMIW